MDTKILEYLVTAAQERSISKAAEKYYLTQPVISRHIKNTEQMFGTRLFIRTHEGISLTDAGRIFINSAQLILRIEAELNKDLEELSR